MWLTFIVHLAGTNLITHSDSGSGVAPAALRMSRSLRLAAARNEIIHDGRSDRQGSPSGRVHLVSWGATSRHGLWGAIVGCPHLADRSDLGQGLELRVQTWSTFQRRPT